MNKRPLIYNTSDALCRGKSLRYLGPWEYDREYVNDEGYQDFVSLDGNLYGCIESNTNKDPLETTDYWRLVLTKGEKGDKGDPYTSLTDEDFERIMEELRTKPISAYEIAKADWEKDHPETDPFMSEKEWIENLESRVIVSKDKKFFGVPEPDNSHNAVRYDEQDRSLEARAIARKNIGAASVYESVTVGDEDPEPFYSVAIDNNTLYNHALLFTEQELSKEQQEQVQENLHLTDRSDYDNLRRIVERIAASDAARLGDLNALNVVLRYIAENEVEGTGNRSESVPDEETFLQAVNRIIYYLGDPIENEFVTDPAIAEVEEQHGIIDSLNYIKAHLSVGTIVRNEARLDPTKVEEESVVTYNFYREAVVDETSVPYAKLDIPTFICENPDLDPESEEFKKAVWDRVENPDYDPTDPDSKKYLSRGPEDLTIKLVSYYEGKVNPETGEFVKDHENAFTLYADVIDGSIRHLHLDEDVNTELAFTNYEHVLDDDYYYKSCLAGTPGFITIGSDISLEEAIKHSLTSEIRNGLIEEGKFVIQVNRGVAEDYEFNQLTTEAQTLREAINELNGKNEKIKEINVVTYTVDVEEPYNFIDGTTEADLEDEISKLYEIVTVSIINGEEKLHKYYILKENDWVISYVSKIQLREKIDLVDGKWVSVDSFVKIKSYIPTIYIINENYPDEEHTDNIRYYSNSIWIPINRPEEDAEFKVYYQVTESLDKRIGNMKDIEIFDDEHGGYTGNYYIVETINEIAHRSERIRSINIVPFDSSDDTMVANNFIDDTDVTLLENGDKLIKFVTRGLTYKDDTTYDRTYYIRAKFYTPSEKDEKPEDAESDQDAYQLTISINDDNTIGANLIYEEFDTPDPDVSGSTKNIDFTDETSFDFK